MEAKGRDEGALGEAGDRRVAGLYVSLTFSTLEARHMLIEKRSP
jgi:hypothetical protein